MFHGVNLLAVTFRAMRSAFMVLFCCGLSASLDAASRITGIVIDASGAPVPGASVTAGTATTVTSDDGTFDLTEAPDGAVTVRATAAGFAPAVLTVNGTTENARLVLQPAPLVDAVVVTASRGEQRLTTPSATTVVTSAELLTSAAGSLDDALRNTPGFSLFRRSSSRVQPGLRMANGSRAKPPIVWFAYQPMAARPSPSPSNRSSRWRGDRTADTWRC